MPRCARVLRVERHELGPRCFLFGWRLHEWQAGVFVLAAAAGAVALGAGVLAGGLGALGAWLLAKDYNDLLPSRRDTTAWGLGVHRRPLRLRDRPRAAGLPRVAGWLTAAVGVTNVVSALTPELTGRVALLAHLAPAGLVLAAHVFVLPAGVALLVLSTYLARRRRRALWLAVAILLGVGGLELLKGLDFEEAIVSWALAGLLAWGRDAFAVRHDDRTLGTALGCAALVLVAAVAAAVIGVLVTAHWTAPALTAGLVLRETFALLTAATGPLHYGDELAWLPLAIGLTSAGALASAAWALFRPMRSAPTAPGAVGRRLVEQHGHDTLSAFKLRPDVQLLVAEDGRAFLSYRVERGVLMISGDPVGAADALPNLVRKTCAFAAERGLRIGAVGASSSFAALARDAGLDSLYLGDEAIVTTAGFSLEGKPIKKVRQAVNRLVRNGYRTELRRVGSLADAELAELEAVSEHWRAGAPERGFSMAMDGLRGDHLADSVVVVARDAEDRARGYLHFVPTYGRAAMSLSAMRRERDTPNGLTDFLIVRAIELLGERGAEELSLNFAAFARWLRTPAGLGERALAWLIRRVDPYFQIVSLYRFNAKFAPRWQPRYLLHEGLVALPRTALAALGVEGQLPRLSLGPG